MKIRLHYAAVYVALAAMMLRALVPAGWMPNTRTAQGASPFVICTMSGPLLLAPDGHSQTPQHQNDDGHGHEMCPFGAAPHSAAPANVALLLAPSSLAQIIERHATDAAPVSKDQYAPQSTRGPPTFA